MTATTTLKLLERLKARIANLARQTGQSAHSLMLQALEREERVREFVKAALASDAAAEAGAAVYRAEDVHAWMERLAKGEKPPRLAPWRK